MLEQLQANAPYHPLVREREKKGEREGGIGGRQGGREAERGMRDRLKDGSHYLSIVLLFASLLVHLHSSLLQLNIRRYMSQYSTSYTVFTYNNSTTTVSKEVITFTTKFLQPSSHTHQ